LRRAAFIGGAEEQGAFGLFFHFVWGVGVRGLLLNKSRYRELISVVGVPEFPGRFPGIPRFLPVRLAICRVNYGCTIRQPGAACFGYDFVFSVQGDLTMSVVLTEKAATEIKRVIAEQNRPELKFVRVGVVGGGCSGFQYSFDFTNAWDESNDVFEEHHGVGIVVDKKSDLYLDGTEIDFYTDLSRRGFTFKNPNAVKSCGCGSSFSA
jgi:iron-sulfur cluster assembly protein